MKKLVEIIIIAVLLASITSFGGVSAQNFLFKFGSFGSGDSEFDQPGDILVDSSGILVVDQLNDRIQKFDSAGVFQGWLGKCTSGSNCDTINQRSIGFSCTAATCSGLSSGSGDGQFNAPDGLALDSSGKIYVVGINNQRIQVFGISVPVDICRGV